MSLRCQWSHDRHDTSPGQGSLQISPDKALTVLWLLSSSRTRKSDESLPYAISDERLPKILGWIKYAIHRRDTIPR